MFEIYISLSDHSILIAISDTTPAADGDMPGPGYKRYRALYQFEARNHDELTLMQGDTVWVCEDFPTFHYIYFLFWARRKNVTA